MKLFQQLLVAPAALGLMATGVNAAELNINGVSNYAASADQVTSVTPSLFYVSRPMGEVSPDGSTFQQLGGLIKTTFVS